MRAAEQALAQPARRERSPHLHTLAVDGAFAKTDAGGVHFHEAPPPSKDDVGGG